MTNIECAPACSAPTEGVITFQVVKEPYGWAIRQGRQMMRPAWCKAFAVEEAQRMADALRRHGELAEVWIEE
ncbi:hypothetical protein [Phenylobacterium soli]|uniref:DUF2188 domain-containing protein n=1 Tax=Phenylobacterium soli TaxID=2170551 RepID=A0A328AH59_9CAUL|nr:hypothetical protein [Phenylobacterium soli]RAK54122.1 hypothetical protein DJ017_06095 [Phenylobacterium soli]